MTFGGLARMGNSIKSLTFVVLGLGILLFIIPPVFPGQIVIESDNQFEFARTSMEGGDYSGAVEEFKRFIHFFPNNPKVPKAHYLIGICHLKDRRHEAARDIFFEIIGSYSEGTFAAKALFLIGESYYQQGVLKEAEYYFVQVIEKYPQIELKNTALYRLGWTKMKGNRWADASQAFSKVEQESRFYDSSQHLAEQSLKGETLLYKSPALAGSLAAIVPGLGHAYVSRYKDAAISFLLNGLFIWAAVESFHEDHEVLGGILTFLEIGWYTGNIYSAVNVSHKHNRKMQNQFRSSLRDRLDLRLFTAREGHVGLALTWRF
jgi:TolA-binding protein